MKIKSDLKKSLLKKTVKRRQPTTVKQAARSRKTKKRGRITIKIPSKRAGISDAENDSLCFFDDTDEDILWVKKDANGWRRKIPIDEDSISESIPASIPPPSSIPASIPKLLPESIPNLTPDFLSSSDDQEEIIYSLDIDYLCGTILPGNLTGLKSPVTIDIRAVHRKIFIGCKTVRIVHNRESVDVRKLPSLYLGSSDTGIGKVYLYALFAPGTDVGEQNRKLFKKFNDFCKGTRFSRCSFKSENFSPTSEHSLSLGCTSSSFKKIKVMGEEIGLFDNWLTETLNTHAHHLKCYYIESVNNKYNTSCAGYSQLHNIVYSIVDPNKFEQLFGDVAGSYWSAENKDYAVLNAGVFERADVVPNYTPLFCTRINNYNKSNIHKMLEMPDGSRILVTKLNIYNGIEDLIPPSYRKSFCGDSYTSNIFLSNLIGCRLLLDERELRKITDLLVYLPLKFRENESLCPSRIEGRISLKENDLLKFTEYLISYAKAEYFDFYHRSQFFRVVAATLDMFAKRIKSEVYCGECVSAFLCASAKHYLFDYLMNDLYLKGRTKARIAGDVKLLSFSPAFSDGIQMPDLADLDALELNTYQERDLILRLIGVNRRLGKTEKAKLLRIFTTYYTADHAFHYLLSLLAEEVFTCVVASEVDNDNVQSDNTSNNPRLINANDYLMRLLTPPKPPKKATIPQFLFTLIKRRFNFESDGGLLLIDILAGDLAKAGVKTVRLKKTVYSLRDCVDNNSSRANANGNNNSRVNANAGNPARANASNPVVVTFSRLALNPVMDQEDLIRIFWGLLTYKSRAAMCNSPLFLVLGVFDVKTLYNRFLTVHGIINNGDIVDTDSIISDNINGAEHAFFEKFAAWSLQNIRRSDVNEYYSSIGLSAHEKREFDSSRFQERRRCIWPPSPSDFHELLKAVLTISEYAEYLRRSSLSRLSDQSRVILAFLREKYGDRFAKGRARNAYRDSNGARLGSPAWEDAISELLTHNKISKLPNRWYQLNTSLSEMLSEHDDA